MSRREINWPDLSKWFECPIQCKRKSITQLEWDLNLDAICNLITLFEKDASNIDFHLV